MKKLTIISILLFWSHSQYAQNDSISCAEVNEILNFCHENIDRDSVITNLESRFEIKLCALFQNLLLYSIQNNINLTQEQIKSIENLTIQITINYYKQGNPIKIFKEGGVGGGGKIRVEKIKMDGFVLNNIFLTQTDLILENDVFEDKLIKIINQSTTELIKNRPK